MAVVHNVLDLRMLEGDIKPFGALEMISFMPLRGDSLERGLDWVGFENYARFLSSSSFWPSVQATLVIVGGVLVITVVLGVFLAILLDQPFWGQGIVRILVIAPFFVMPTVSALVWKNMFMNPVNGIFGQIATSLGKMGEDLILMGDLNTTGKTGRSAVRRLMRDHLDRERAAGPAQ